MHRAEPVFFNELLNYALENTDTRMLKCLTVLQQYLNDMHIFGYDAKDTRRLLNKKGARWVEKDLEGVSSLSFHSASNLSIHMVTFDPSAYPCKGLRQHLLAEIISLDIEERQECRWSLYLRVPMRRFFILACTGSHACLPVSIPFAPVAKCKERA